MYSPVGNTFKNILLIIDIQSRKAWAYVISSTSGENILNAYKKFESEVDIINAIEGYIKSTPSGATEPELTRRFYIIS